MSSVPETLALIPARGGSKSIPRKNLVPVAGNPLIAYSIDHALRSAYITRTIVSTDDAEIAEVARALGAEVPFLRPAELASDESTDLEVFRHALEWLREKEGYVPELVVHLRPTGPVRRPALIDAAIEKMLQHPEAHSLRSVSAPIQTPYKMWSIVEDRLEPLLSLEGVGESHSVSRQSLPRVWWQNGYVDVVRPATVLDLGLMAGTIVIPFIVREPIHELDYAESIPAIEDAIARLERGESPVIPNDPERHSV